MNGIVLLTNLNLVRIFLVIIWLILFIIICWLILLFNIKNICSVEDNQAHRFLVAAHNNLVKQAVISLVEVEVRQSMQLHQVSIEAQLHFLVTLEQSQVVKQVDCLNQRRVSLERRVLQLLGKLLVGRVYLVVKTHNHRVSWKKKVVRFLEVLTSRHLLQAYSVVLVKRNNHSNLLQQ